MISLAIWIIWLVFLLFLCVMRSKRVLLTPQFGFIGCFLPQAIFAIYFVKIWEINFSYRTMLVLMGGTGLFFIISVFFQNLSTQRSIKYSWKAKGIEENKQMAFQELVIERWKLLLLLALQIVILCFFVVYIYQNVQGLTIVAKIAAINNVYKFGTVNDRIVFPAYLAWPRCFCMASCYVTGYALAHSLLLKYRQHNILLSINILVSLINILTTGGRFGIVSFFVAWIVEFYIIWGKSNNWRANIKFKAILAVIIICTVVILTFQKAASWVGRNSESDFVYYLGVYIAAPIKNLDIYIRKGKFGTDISKWQTLRLLIDAMGRKLDIPKWIHQDDLPFVQVNGYGLGNVYTIFYCYLHDGGFVAVVVFVLFQAIVAQIAYQKAVYGKQNHKIDLHIIIYSYMLQAIVFSFFGDRFYNNIVSLSFVQYFICWWMLAFFLERVKVKCGRGQVPASNKSVIAMYNG